MESNGDSWDHNVSYGLNSMWPTGVIRLYHIPPIPPKYAASGDACRQH